MSSKQVLIGVGLFVAGAGIGSVVTSHILKKKFKDLADEEIESVRKSYAKASMPKPDLSDIRRSEDLGEKAEVLTEDEAIIFNQGYRSSDYKTDSESFRANHGRVPTTYELIQMGKGVPVEKAVRNNFDHDDSGLVEGNIFDTPQPDPEDLVELPESTLNDDEPVHNQDRPYVIEAAEWYLNETNYDQITLTFWADDEVLIDDSKRVITDVDSVVGATNLHRFGFKSEDPEIVYVRNERLEVDYEITKDDRSYSEVKHGVDSNDRDEQEARRSRMRSNDE
jgi:hypothetical protein